MCGQARNVTFYIKCRDVPVAATVAAATTCCNCRGCADCLTCVAAGRGRSDLLRPFAEYRNRPVPITSTSTSTSITGQLRYRYSPVTQLAGNTGRLESGTSLSACRHDRQAISMARHIFLGTIF